MASIVLSLHGVIAATLFMLLIHLHLTQTRGLTVSNTLGFSASALLWPLALCVLVYVAYVRKDPKQERLQQGLSEGRWRTVMDRADTNYEIDGEAFTQYEQRELAKLRQGNRRRHPGHVAAHH